MKWLIENHKKLLIFLIATFVLMTLIILHALDVTINEQLEGAIGAAWVLSLKEWLDGKPD